MLGEFFAGVETEDCDIHPVTPVYDLGDNGTGPDRYFASGISDQRMGHSSIIVPPESTRHSRRIGQRLGPRPELGLGSAPGALRGAQNLALQPAVWDAPGLLSPPDVRGQLTAVPDRESRQDTESKPDPRFRAHLPCPLVLSSPTEAAIL